MSEINEPEFVKVEKSKLHKILIENVEMRRDIGLFIKEGPGAILTFLGKGTTSPIAALGKAMGEMMRSPEKFKRTGEVGGHFLEKYKHLSEDKPTLTINTGE